MNDFFIVKSKGIAQNDINHNFEKHQQNVEWDIDYNGRQADIGLDMETDGIKQHIQFQLDNEDLAKILGFPSDPLMMDERLAQEFPLETEAEPDWDELDYYNEPPLPPPQPKIRIQIIPGDLVKPNKTHRRHSTKHRHPSLTRRVLTGRLPSKRQSRNRSRNRIRSPRSRSVQLHQIQH